MNSILKLTELSSPSLVSYRSSESFISSESSMKLESLIRCSEDSNDFRSFSGGY